MITLEHATEAENPDEIKADRWKNLHFTKFGPTVLSIRSFPSVEAARESLQKALRKNGAHPTIQIFYSHSIQIPWSKDA